MLAREGHIVDENQWCIRYCWGDNSIKKINERYDLVYNFCGRICADQGSSIDHIRQATASISFTNKILVLYIPVDFNSSPIKFWLHLQ